MPKKVPCISKQPHSVCKIQRTIPVRYLFDLTCKSWMSCPYLTSCPCCLSFSFSFCSFSTSAASDNFWTKASTSRDWPGLTDLQNCRLAAQRHCGHIRNRQSRYLIGGTWRLPSLKLVTQRSSTKPRVDIKPAPSAYIDITSPKVISSVAPKSWWHSFVPTLVITDSNTLNYTEFRIRMFYFRNIKAKYRVFMKHSPDYPNKRINGN